MRFCASTRLEQRRPIWRASTGSRKQPCTTGRPSTAAWTYRMPGGLRASGRREPQAEEAVGGIDARQRGAEGAADKKCMVRPGVARSFVLLSETACVNVSGLSRVSCCCSQAMMRCARIVPNKWYEHKGLDFLTGLTMRRSTVPTSVLGPRNLTNVMLRHVLARPVRRGCAGA